jgi:hypothetical protein
MPIAHLNILRRTQFTWNELSETQMSIQHPQPSLIVLSISFKFMASISRLCPPNGYPSIARGQVYKFAFVSEEIRPSGRSRTHAGVDVWRWPGPVGVNFRPNASSNQIGVKRLLIERFKIYRTLFISFKSVKNWPSSLNFTAAPLNFDLKLQRKTS